MPILLLVRHATNDFVKTARLPGQLPNIHLNEEGRGQALTVGKYLSDRKIAAVYSSSLERAIETAWHIAVPHGLSVHISPNLADTNCGDYTGKLLKELAENPESKDVWKTIVEKPSEARLPNGETLLAVQERVVAELERICSQYPDPEPPIEDHPTPPEAPEQPKPPTEPPPAPPCIIVVMHADTIKAAIAHYLGMPFDNFQRLNVSPASISAIMIHKEHATLLSLNQVQY